MEMMQKRTKVHATPAILFSLGLLVILTLALPTVPASSSGHPLVRTLFQPLLTAKATANGWSEISIHQTIPHAVIPQPATPTPFNQAVQTLGQTTIWQAVTSTSR